MLSPAQGPRSDTHAPRLCAAPLLLEHGAVVQVCQLGQRRYQRLAVAGDLAHHGVALQVQAAQRRQPLQQAHDAGVCYVVVLQVQRLQLPAACEGLERRQRLEAVVLGNKRRERGAGRDSVEAGEAVAADIEGDERGRVLDALEAGQAVVLDKPAPACMVGGGAEPSDATIRFVSRGVAAHACLANSAMHSEQCARA